MRRIQTFIIFIIIGAISVACGTKNGNQEAPGENKVDSCTGKLVQIDYSDTNYYDLRSYIKDTITPGGWKIRYLVKDDSTKYKDIYIECSKDSMKGIFYGSDLLQFKRYFIPVFAGETKSHLFLRPGCATDCSAVLTFSKDSTGQFNDYQNVIDYNINLGQILFVTDSCYENEDKIFELGFVDLNRSVTRKITFNQVCMNVFKPGCVDTVIFSKKQLIIKATLADQSTHMKEIKQTRILNLE
jgi:hypothetical protein